MFFLENWVRVRVRINFLVCFIVTDNNIFNNNISIITLLKTLASFHSGFDFEVFNACRYKLLFFT